MKKYDVTALGELLIDFTENGISPQGNPLLEANPGGAPCNVLAMLSKLGKHTAFIGKVGADMFGRQLSETIKEAGICADGLVADAGVPTTLAFVHTFAGGERQMVTEKNNLHDIDTFMFFKWVFKTYAAVLIVTNTWNIVMGVFDAAQQVVNQSAGVIIGNTSIDIDSLVGDLQTSLEAMSLGGLIGLWFQSLFVGLTMNILSICIMLVVYGRMIEIYLVTSLGPIPLATMTNGEWRNVGQNYLKSLLALGFQAFLIMVVVGIYSVLIQSISATGDVSGAIWLAMGYTVLLCFCLFKTGSMAKAVFSAH